MSLLLALHSSSPVLGVALLDLDRPDAPPALQAFDLGRALSNQLFDSIEQLLPAARWSELGRLAVATGPGGFTGTRLTVVLARTLAQQLQLPLDGVCSFALVAARLALSEPTWLCQNLPRRGTVAGLYQADSAAVCGVAELAAPRLFPVGTELPPGPCAAAAVQIPDDLLPLLRWSAAQAAAASPAPWQLVLPLYPTSPVDA